MFTYELPPEFQPETRPDVELASRTYFAVREFFARCIPARSPADADYFFVPLNLIQFQFENDDPSPMLAHLTHLDRDKPNHILVAAGDFSHRSRRNHFGEAYRQLYDWLDPFVLVAHESTGDLISGQDIGVYPYHAIAGKPKRRASPRPYLYSFFGALDHVFLPSDHVRSRLAKLDAWADDVLIASGLDDKTRHELRTNYRGGDDFELVARNSVFTLAPAGYGRWTYRFFQAIRWGSIPVLLSDDYVKPFADRIPYDDFSLTVPEGDLDQIDSILRSIGEDRIREYQEALARHQQDFTEEAFFRNLTSELEARL